MRREQFARQSCEPHRFEARAPSAAGGIARRRRATPIQSLEAPSYWLQHAPERRRFHSESPVDTTTLMSPASAGRIAARGSTGGAVPRSAARLLLPPPPPTLWLRQESIAKDVTALIAASRTNLRLLMSAHRRVRPDRASCRGSNKYYPFALAILS